MSQQYYKIAKKNYDNGMWNLAMIQNLLRLGRITQEEYDDIVGETDE